MNAEIERKAFSPDIMEELQQENELTQQYGKLLASAQIQMCIRDRYTPMFAVARVVGWSAHRMEELVNVDKIIRPAYKSVMATRDYLPMENRG